MKANYPYCGVEWCGHAECDQARDISRSRCALCNTPCGRTHELLDLRSPAQIEAGIFHAGFVHARCERVLKRRLLKRLAPPSPRPKKRDRPAHQNLANPERSGFRCYGDVLYEVPVAPPLPLDLPPRTIPAAPLPNYAAILDTFNLATFPKKAARRVTRPRKTDAMRLAAADRRATWRRRNSATAAPPPPLAAIEQIAKLAPPAPE